MRKKSIKIILIIKILFLYIIYLDFCLFPLNINFMNKIQHLKFINKLKFFIKSKIIILDILQHDYLKIKF